MGTLCTAYLPRSKTNLCCVFDIDHTLIHTDSSGTIAPKNDPSVYEIYTYHPNVSNKDEYNDIYMWGTYRPYLREFLNFAKDYFKVIAVWSAGQKFYVKEIVDKIWDYAGLDVPKIVYSYQDITDTKTLVKSLRHMFKDRRTCNLMKPENTLLIDDNTRSFLYDQYNGLLIPEFRRGMTDDVALKELEDWLMSDDVMNAEDVRKLDKSRIFKWGM